MASSTATTLDNIASGTIKGGTFTTGGRDVIYNVYNYLNYNTGVSFSDVISFIQTVAQPFIAWTSKNQATGVDDDTSLSQTVTTDHAPQSPIEKGCPVDICDLVPSNPSSLPVSTVADRYTRSMLECTDGYPLYEPHPFCQHSKEYLRNGVNVGDVGFVTEYGNFDFLFNICPPHNSLVNPPNLSHGFSLEAPEDSETMPIRPLAPGTCLFPPSIKKTKSGEYTCKGSEGAILELPEGAIECGAINKGLFKELAKRHGVEWYEHAKRLGRGISHESLYLVTSSAKCTQWGIAVFDRVGDPDQALTFISSPPSWEGSGALFTRVADEGDTLNQCVLLRGYKIMIRPDIFNQLPTRRRASRDRGGGGSDFMSKLLFWKRIKRSTVEQPDAVVLHANFNSSPVHPADLINAELLNQNPDAKIALTHDDVWCDLLRDNFPELNLATLINISRSYTNMVDEHGCVCLEKLSDPSSVLDENSYQGNETPAPQVPIQDARDDRNPDVSIQAQASTALRQPAADHFPSDADEGNPSPGILIPSQTPTPTPTLHVSRDREVQSRQTKDSMSSMSSIQAVSATVDHSIWGPRIEDLHGIPIQEEVPIVAKEHSFIGHEEVDVQSRQAGDGVFDFTIPAEGSTVVLEPYFVVHRDGDAGRPSTPSYQPLPISQLIDSDLDEVRYIRFGDDKFTDVQMNLICDCIANPSMLPDADDSLKKHVLTQSIMSLPRAAAVFTDYQTRRGIEPCFEGTRVALLREMANWVTSPGESSVYVLSGMAGIGKSTVAYTIATRAADLNLLGASFFFSRDEADLKSTKKFFTTLAYQLCVYKETFSKAVGDVLQTARGSTAKTKGPLEQLQTLIVEPLQSIIKSSARPILVVVDALDECDEEDGILVLTGLEQLVQALPSIKVILTTRPQPYLDHFFDSPARIIFHVQAMEDKVIENDIRRYLNHCLSVEQIQKHYPKLQWCASDDEIDSLSRATGRLFITASTVVRYIIDKSVSNPATQMQNLLHVSVDNHTPFKDLDELYTLILRNLVPKNCNNENIVGYPLEKGDNNDIPNMLEKPKGDDGTFDRFDDDKMLHHFKRLVSRLVDDEGNATDVVRRYQTIVGAIMFIQWPLPVSALACLIDINAEEIRAVLEKFQSVVLLLGDDVPRIYHKSFSDYVVDQTRCKDRHLQIDPRKRHAQIASCCFGIMNKHLRYNILGLGYPARFMSNKEGLEKDRIGNKQLQEMIPSHLRYACIYWAHHLKNTKLKISYINEDVHGLKTFMNEHVLHWLEVLSLVGKLGLAQPAIESTLNSSILDLYSFLKSVLRFIIMYNRLVEQSALHVYYSALSFMPVDSPVYDRYINETTHNIYAVDYVSERHDIVIISLAHGKRVDVVKFSLDRTLFASCSTDDRIEPNQRNLKIWDATTGTQISIIPGDKFAVTNDISSLVSSKDNIITFYDVNGSEKGTVITTSSRVRRLALSDRNRIAAALSDGTVWLWEAKNAELIGNFDGFKSSGYWPQLQFSFAGTRLAYSSVNGIITLLDGITGKFVADLQCGSWHTFEFSNDGTRIASLSDEYGLTLWDSERGTIISAVGEIDDIDLGTGVLATSENGSLLATAYYDAKVKLWSANDNLLVQTEILEARFVRSMAFSPDNVLAIATDYRIKLYSVETHTFVSTIPLMGEPFALAFSPDHTHLAAGNYDGSVYVWNVQDIDACGLPSKTEATAVTALALSRDSSRLACGFRDGTIELSGMSPTKRRISLRQGHRHMVSAVEFGPDGGLFATGSYEGTVRLWDGQDGSLRGTLRTNNRLRAVALSNSLLVAAGHKVTLWSLDTLGHIHTFEKSGRIVSTVSIAEDSALVAIVSENRETTNVLDGVGGSIVSLLDVANCTVMATFDVPHIIDTISFLPDNSQLVAQSREGVFLSLDPVDKGVVEGPRLELLIQLPNIPLWHDIPIWHCQNKERRYLSGLFPQHNSPVPVLWIPRYLSVSTLTQGSSVIALGCEDGKVVLLRLRTNV